MSKVDFMKCDGCSSVVQDEYAAVGWIRIETSGPNSIVIARSAGRRADGQALSDYLQLGRRADFCSSGCLLRALDRAAAARQEKTGG